MGQQISCIQCDGHPPEIIWAVTRGNQSSGFQPGLTQTSLYVFRSRLEASNFGFKKKRDCTIPVAKAKALISFAVTAKLI